MSKVLYGLGLGVALIGLAAGCSQGPKVSESAAAGKAYPLDTCLVSDEKLGSMGDAVVFVYSGQQVKLCCNNCRKDFDKDPAKYLAKLDKKK